MVKASLKEKLKKISELVHTTREETRKSLTRQHNNVPLYKMSAEQRKHATKDSNKEKQVKDKRYGSFREKWKPNKKKYKLVDGVIHEVLPQNYDDKEKAAPKFRRKPPKKKKYKLVDGEIHEVVPKDHTPKIKPVVKTDELSNKPRAKVIKLQDVIIRPSNNNRNIPEEKTPVNGITNDENPSCEQIKKGKKRKIEANEEVGEQQDSLTIEPKKKKKKKRGKVASEDTELISPDSNGMESNDVSSKKNEIVSEDNALISRDLRGIDQNDVSSKKKKKKKKKGDTPELISSNSNGIDANDVSSKKSEIVSEEKELISPELNGIEENNVSSKKKKKKKRVIISEDLNSPDSKGTEANDVPSKKKKKREVRPVVSDLISPEMNGTEAKDVSSKPKKKKKKHKESGVNTESEAEKEEECEGDDATEAENVEETLPSQRPKLNMHKLEPNTIIDGKKVDEAIEIIYTAGIPVGKADAQAIVKKWTAMLKQGVLEKDIFKVLRILITSAEKKLVNGKNTACYTCRRFGHAALNCKKSMSIERVCFKCGNDRHTTKSCKVAGDDYPLAECPVCLGKGHLARQCFYKEIVNMKL